MEFIINKTKMRSHYEADCLIEDLYVCKWLADFPKCFLRASNQVDIKKSSTQIKWEIIRENYYDQLNCKCGNMKLLIRICGGDEEKKSTEQFEKKKTIRPGFLIRSGTGCGDNERSTSKEVTANFGSRGLFPFKSGSPRTPWPYFNIKHFILKKKPTSLM